MRKYLLMLTVMVFAVILMAAPALARESATPSLTLQQAVEMAKAQSETIRNDRYEIERGELVNDSAALKMLFAPTSPTTITARSYFLSYKQSGIDLEMSERSYVADLDTLVMQTLQSYNSVLQGMEAVDVAKAQLKTAEWNYRVAVVSKQVGILNSLDFIKAGAALFQAGANLSIANKSLDDNYQKFNQSVGLWPEDRPVLVDEPIFEKITIENLETEVERAVGKSPTVWLMQRQVDLADISRRLYNLAGTSSIEPYETKKIDVEMAELSAVQTEEQVRILVRSIYYRAVQLEDQYDSAQESVKVADETLRVARIKYEVGMVAKGEVLTAEANLETAQQSLLSIVTQHQALSLAFSKPWSYSG